MLLTGYTSVGTDINDREPVDFKIIISSDTTCNTGTRYQYILTNEFYRLIYLKDENIIRDTIVDEQRNFMSDSIQYLILHFPDFITTNKAINNCLPVCNIAFNGEARSFSIDPEHPQEIFCKIVNYMNVLAAEKYRIDLCDEN